jgi:hypothetical protein
MSRSRSPKKSRNDATSQASRSLSASGVSSKSTPGQPGSWPCGWDEIRQSKASICQDLRQERRRHQAGFQLEQDGESNDGVSLKTVFRGAQSMRRAKLGTALLLALAFVLATVGASRAEECNSNVDLSDGSKEQAVNAIIDWADCIQRNQRGRVGKYFCFVKNSAGIQHNQDGSTFAGQIKPPSERFFVEISEFLATRDWRRKICGDNAFGLLRDRAPDEEGKRRQTSISLPAIFA